MNDVQASLLDRIVTERPDPEAWRALVALCRRDHTQHADLALTNLLANRLAQVNRELRGPVLAAVADALAGMEPDGLAALLASDAEESARHLALELVARWPGALPRELLQSLRGLFLDRRLPEAPQLGAAATLLRSLGADADQAEGLLRTLVSGLGKARSIDRLRRLESLVGKLPVLDALCEHLEDQLRMTCPRCEAEMRRPDMQRHLWEEHRLLLIGRRVREPWSVIEEWIDAWKAGGPPILAERCRNLAQHLDAEQGLRQVNRLILRSGLDDAEARQYLVEEALEQHASLCPRCLALLPVPREIPPWALTFRGGRVAARGYLVDLSDRGLQTRLEVRTPTRLVYRGREPSHLLTPRGMVFGFAGPFVVLALACALAGVELVGSTLSPVVLFLSLAGLAYGCVLWDLRERPRLPRRAILYAWTVLAPRLLEEGYNSDDASFLAALAQVDDGSEGAVHRARVLPRLIQVLEEALARGQGAPFHLVALCLRQVADEAAAGTSPEGRIAALVGRCFDGKLPLTFADQLLEGWRKEWHTGGGAARLRILICDRAFEAGFEVRPLVEAGQTAPALGEILRVSRTRELAALRLLWSLRASRPWQHCGPVLTAFDLAAYPGNEARLAAMPDVLFYQADSDWPRELDADGAEIPFRIAVRASGLMVQGELFERPPRPVRAKVRLEDSDLVVGEATFRAKKGLAEVSKRIKQWSAYFFSRFRPALADVLEWKSPEKDALLRAWGAVNCPECGKPALPRVAKLAVPIGKERGARTAETNA